MDLKKKEGINDEEDYQISFSPNIEEKEIRTSEEYTLNDAIEHIGFGRFQIKVFLIVGFCWVADAMEMMVLSTIGPALKCEWHLSSSQEAFITTTVFIGTGFGSVGWGFFADRFGRKKGIIASGLMILVFGVASSQSPNYAWILILRFTVGLGLGGVPQAVTIATEVLPVKIRGKALLLLAIFWAIGSVFAATLALGTIEDLNWRWFLIFINIPVAMFLLITLWIPESPHYLEAVGDYEGLKKLVEQISKENGKELPKGKLVPGEINDSRGNFTELFSKKWLRTTVPLCFIWMVSALAYYGIVLLPTEMFQSGIDGCNALGNHEVVAGFNSTIEVCHELNNTDYVDFIITSSAEFPGLFVGVALIDLIGRRKTLSSLFGVSGIAFVLLMFCTSRTTNVILMFIVRAFVNTAFMTTYVYTPEVLPTNIRSVGLGLCNCFSRIGAIITPFIAQVLISETFYGCIGLYTGFLVSCSVVALLLSIETKGRSLASSTTVSVVINNRYQHF